MKAALHIQTHVLPGGKIEIPTPHLREGDPVEVVLLVPEPATQPRRSALEIIASLRGHRLFQTPEEVDRYLQQERDAWER